MTHALYDALVPWYLLLDPREDHEDEVAEYAAVFGRVLGAAGGTLLELGAGAGNNASYFGPAWRCTLVDLSPRMSELSRARNPGAEHVIGDMRTIRLGRTFDAVLVHDAIVYMTTEAELQAAAESAFVHTRPGGAALFVPDCLRESFRESSDLHEGDDGRRSLRCLEWSWDPDPSDSTYTVEYALLLREGGEVTAIHDRHVEGLFDEQTWIRVLERVGFEVDVLVRDLGEVPGPYTDRMFLGRRHC